MTEVRPVASSADFKRFIDYQYIRNRSDPHWVPPLRLAEKERLQPKKNPFFAHADHQLLLAWRDGSVAGRIAAFDDRLHNEVHEDNAASFGFFDADDDAAAAALLGAVDAWARAKGRRRVLGPLNPSLNESAGLLVDGFDTDPMLMMPHNPPEYAAFIERAGYRKAKDLYAWLYDMRHDIDPVIARLAARVREKHGITTRKLSLKEFQREVEQLRVIYCGAWERNWGFVAPTPAEFKRLATELKPIFDPDAAVLAEVGGKPIACAVAVPDVNQAFKGTDGRLFPKGLIRLLGRKRIINQARLLLLGVLPEYRAAGVYPVLVDELHRQTRATPYRRLEFSWVLEDNRDINQPAAQAGATHYKTYRIYEKSIA
jgi:GNAT superfamily N-acetyltransferase